MQLVFGSNAIMNVMHLADWQYIQNNCQQLIKRNNEQEDEKWKPHEYHVNNEVMIKKNQKLKYRSNTYSGPCQITEVQDNDTVCVKSSKITDTYSIQNVMPYRK
eukprot:5932145-Ditylum_brightwellii.AAC.1